MNKYLKEIKLSSYNIILFYLYRVSHLDFQMLELPFILSKKTRLITNEIFNFDY